MPLTSIWTFSLVCLTLLLPVNWVKHSQTTLAESSSPTLGALSTLALMKPKTFASCGFRRAAAMPKSSESLTSQGEIWKGRVRVGGVFRWRSAYGLSTVIYSWFISMFTVKCTSIDPTHVSYLYILYIDFTYTKYCIFIHKRDSTVPACR